MTDDRPEYKASASARADASPRRRRKINRLFARTVEVEGAFFATVYDPEETVSGGGQRW